MIRFFRTQPVRQAGIRQNLLAQGRVARYFTYAIGEILLVVIGILIAGTSPVPWRGVPAHHSIYILA